MATAKQTRALIYARCSTSEQDFSRQAPALLLAACPPGHIAAWGPDGIRFCPDCGATEESAPVAQRGCPRPPDASYVAPVGANLLPRRLGLRARAGRRPPTPSPADGPFWRLREVLNASYDLPPSVREEALHLLALVARHRLHTRFGLSRQAAVDGAVSIALDAFHLAPPMRPQLKEDRLARRLCFRARRVMKRELGLKVPPLSALACLKSAAQLLGIPPAQQREAEAFLAAFLATSPGSALSPTVLAGASVYHVVGRGATRATIAGAVGIGKREVGRVRRRMEGRLSA